MSHDPITELRNAGVPVDLLSEAQLATFAALSEGELATLLTIQGRINDVDADVQGQESKNNNVL